MDDFSISNLHFPVRLTLTDLLDGLADIEIDRTVGDTSSTTHTGDPAEILRIVVELMHEPLACPLTTCGPRVVP